MCVCTTHSVGFLVGSKHISITLHDNLEILQSLTEAYTSVLNLTSEQS